MLSGVVHGSYSGHQSGTNSVDPGVTRWGTATLMAQRGLGFSVEPELVADRKVCDGLVESGHLAAVEGVEGGYVLSDQMIAAHGITLARQAEEAKLN